MINLAYVCDFPQAPYFLTVSQSRPAAWDMSEKWLAPSGQEEEPIIQAGGASQASTWVVCFLACRLGLRLELSTSKEFGIVGKVEQGRMRLYI